jgi:hypothetical protein
MWLNNVPVDDDDAAFVYDSMYAANQSQGKWQPKANKRKRSSSTRRLVADLAELEAEEQRLTMPPPPPRLSRRERAIAAAAKDRQLIPPPPPRLSVETSLARSTVL